MTSPRRRGDVRAGLAVSADARAVKRRLGPLGWSVLEDVALDAAVDEHGEWVAATNCRRVASNLGVTPGTAARALARLEAEGVSARTVQLGRTPGPDRDRQIPDGRGVRAGSTFGVVTGRSKVPLSRSG